MVSEGLRRTSPDTDCRFLLQRFFNKLKHFRAIATRYEKHDAYYLAAVRLAAARIWMKFNESVT
jgi:transposase